MPVVVVVVVVVVPAGYVYVLFENERRVKRLLFYCQRNFDHDAGGYYYQVSSQRMKHKWVRREIEKHCALGEGRGGRAVHPYALDQSQLQR